MARKSRVLTDHDEIRRWAEERDAQPACVRGTGSEEDVGMVRLDFPGYSGETSLEPIEWDEWLQKFDENNLALLVEEETASGQASNFNKIIGRDTAALSEGRKTSRRGKRGAQREGSRTTGRRSRSSARARSSRGTRSRSAAKRPTASRRSRSRSGRSTSSRATSSRSSSRSRSTRAATGKKRAQGVRGNSRSRSRKRAA